MSVLERLTDKVGELLNRIDELRAEIERLQREKSVIESESKEKDIQINTLYEELAARDRQSEELINRIDRAQQ